MSWKTEEEEMQHTIHSSPASSLFSNSLTAIWLVSYHILVEVTSEECLVEDQVRVIVQHAVDVGEVMTVICGPGVCVCVVCGWGGGGVW